MENVILGKDFNLGTTSSFFHVLTHLHLLNALIDDDESGLNIELGTFAKKRKVIVIIDYFLSFLIKYDERKTHNMLTLM
jgi:hypothetical protein